MEVTEISHAMNDDQSYKYRWVAFMDRLSGGDITKYDDIYKKNYLETLNLLSWWHVCDQAERLASKNRS